MILDKLKRWKCYLCGYAVRPQIYYFSWSFRHCDEYSWQLFTEFSSRFPNLGNIFGNIPLMWVHSISLKNTSLWHASLMIITIIKVCHYVNEYSNILTNKCVLIIVILQTFQPTCYTFTFLQISLKKGKHKWLYPEWPKGESAKRRSDVWACTEIN